MKKTLILLALCSACGNITESTLPASGLYSRQSTLPQGKVSIGSLNGNWKSQCISDLAQLKYYSMELSFQQDLLVSHTINYSDVDCKTAITEEERLAKIELDTTNEVNATLSETIVSMKYRPLNDATAVQLIDKKHCGYDNWIKQQYRVFLDSTVCGVSQSGLFQLEIYGERELHLKSDSQTVIFERNSGT